MSTEDTLTGDAGKPNRYHFDRHTPEYRERFTAITMDMHAKCPVAWTDTYGGHWVAAGNREVFELARCPYVSNDNDVTGERAGYKGITIPTPPQSAGVRGGMLEMDEPEHTAYRSILNSYLSPAAVKRWVPFVDEIVRASIDEKIEVGQIDFVDDLANIAPAVLTLAMMGVPLKPACTRPPIPRKPQRYSSRRWRWEWTCWATSSRSARTHAPAWWTRWQDSKSTANRPPTSNSSECSP